MGVHTFDSLIENASYPRSSETQSGHKVIRIQDERLLRTPSLPTRSHAPNNTSVSAVVADRVNVAGPPIPTSMETFEISMTENRIQAIEAIQTVWDPYMNRFRFVAACLTAFCGGLSDSAPGALLPYIEEDHNIGYAVVSMIFVANALGFVGAAFFISFVTNKYGRSKALMLAETLLLGGYVTIVIGPPFPAVVFAFFLTGMGAATNLAICQVFCANLENGTLVGGIYQGVYGIGGTIGPLIATSIVSTGYHWNTYYFIPLGISAFGFAWCGWAFWSYERENPQVYDGHAQNVTSTSRWAKFKAIITDKPTLLGSIFIFAYQGSEVAISGWVVSFLISYRGGDINRVGYVTAGFWAGITLGRFTLAHLGARIGERSFVFWIAAAAIVLELLVWFLPSIIGSSISVALAGFVLGPVYPAATTVFVRLIPRQMQVSSFSFIASVGSSGGAFIPFITGILAQQAGTWVLHPICIGLFAVMVGFWFAMPKVEKRVQ